MEWGNCSKIGDRKWKSEIGGRRSEKLLPLPKRIPSPPKMQKLRQGTGWRIQERVRVRLPEIGNRRSEGTEHSAFTPAEAHTGEGGEH